MELEIVSKGWQETIIKLDGKELKNVKSFNFNCEARKMPTLTIELYIDKNMK